MRVPHCLETCYCKDKHQKVNDSMGNLEGNFLAVAEHSVHEDGCGGDCVVLEGLKGDWTWLIGNFKTDRISLTN